MARNGNQHAAEALLRPVEPDEHWKALREGDRVRVRLAPGYEASGFVDAITLDRTALWVDFDNGLGRTLLHCSDGVEVVLHES